jgi:hypothetical protein
MATGLAARLFDPVLRIFRAQNDVDAISDTSRFLLWVDAVGGFMVCLADKVKLGQAVPGGPADIPLLADLSRHHATIRRDAEGYWMEPVRDVWVAGRRLAGPWPLVDGSQVTLGESLKLTFRRPHPLSATARLDFAGGHHTQPSTAAVLLMAETCVLGPASQCHVVCRDWKHNVVLMRQGSELYCRTEGVYEVDGRTTSGRTRLGLRSRVVGEHFSFGLEGF